MNLGKFSISVSVPFPAAEPCVELAGRAERAEREWGYDAIWLAKTNGPAFPAFAPAFHP